MRMTSLHHTSRSIRVWVFLLFVACLGNFTLGASSRAGHRQVKPNVSLHAKLNKKAFPASVVITISNRTEKSIWFPIEAHPSMKLENGRGSITVCLGLFANSVGEIDGTYQIPRFHEVRPGEAWELALDDPALAGKVSNGERAIKVKARIATHAFVFSDVRGAQPLREYLDNSFVLEVDGIAQD